MKFSSFSALLLSSLALARPSPKRRSSSFLQQNGVDVDNQFMDVSSSCPSGNACIDGQIAQCVDGKYVVSPCSPGLTCVDSPATGAICTGKTGFNKRTVAAGANATTSPSPPLPTPTDPCDSGPTNSSTAPGQASLTLLPSVIATNFSQNGLNTTTSEADEVASLTSVNNFINFCATVPNLPITNGRQLKNESCNPAPMGVIPSTSNMPSAKFVTPVNLAVVPANTTFQITLAVRNFATGYFVNPDTNYFSAPQQLDPETGYILGHAHVVIEALESLNQTTPTNPTKFAFFAAMNHKADARGYLYANVTGGLPKGTYKMSTILGAMNHQPVLLPIAERGVADDVIYFTVDGAGTTTPAPTNPPQPSEPAPTSSTPSAVAPSPPIPTQSESC